MKTKIYSLVIAVLISLTSFGQLMKFEIKNLSNPNAISNTENVEFNWGKAPVFDLEVKLGDKIQITSITNDQTLLINSIGYKDINNNNTQDGTLFDGRTFTVSFTINSVNIDKVIIMYALNVGYFFIHPKFVSEYTKDTNSGGGGTGGESTTGLSTTNLSTVRLYPNPTSEVLTLSTENFKLETVNVVDLKGKVVYSQPLNEGQQSVTLNLHNIPSGTYFIPYEDGKAPLKFVKE